MRTISRTGAFKKDYHREKSGVLGKKLDELLNEAIATLRIDQPLPPRYHDHPMSGLWGKCRDCHIRPDLVLIYHKSGDTSLELVRLGSHSELGL
jgi:mRNA interferase YafQ